MALWFPQAEALFSGALAASLQCPHLQPVCRDWHAMQCAVDAAGSGEPPQPCGGPLRVVTRKVFCFFGSLVHWQEGCSRSLAEADFPRTLSRPLRACAGGASHFGALRCIAGVACLLALQVPSLSCRACTCRGWAHTGVIFERVCLPLQATRCLPWDAAGCLKARRSRCGRCALSPTAASIMQRGASAYHVI